MTHLNLCLFGIIFRCWLTWSWISCCRCFSLSWGGALDFWTSSLCNLRASSYQIFTNTNISLKKFQLNINVNQFLITRRREPGKILFHMFHLWLVFCLFVLNKEIFSNICCLSSSMSEGLNFSSAFIIMGSFFNRTKYHYKNKSSKKWLDQEKDIFKRLLKPIF